MDGVKGNIEAVDDILAHYGGLDLKYRAEGQTFVTTFLKHYGVKGMHWGIRKEEETSRSKTPGVDPLIVSTATYYGAVIAAYSVFHLVDSGKFHALTNKQPLKVNKKLAAPNMSVDSLHKSVVKPINPDFGKMGTKMNCRRCTFAYELRRRGIDVKATKSLAATGQGTKSLIKAANKSSISPHIKTNIYGEHPISKKNFYDMTARKKSDEIFNSLNNMPNRSRGELCVVWKFGGAHSLAWENVNKKSVIFDTQSGKIMDLKAMEKLAENMGDASYTRLDNLDLNIDFLGRWVQNVE